MTFQTPQRRDDDRGVRCPGAPKKKKRSRSRSRSRHLSFTSTVIRNLEEELDAIRNHWLIQPFLEYYLTLAIDRVTKAIQCDKKKNFKEALRYYEQSMNYFMNYCKLEKDKAVRNQVMKIVETYMDRAEQMKEIIKQQKEDHRGRNTQRVWLFRRSQRNACVSENLDTIANESLRDKAILRNTQPRI